MMNGFLIVDKRAGMTSYDVIRRLKKFDRYNKIGYIGTLDRNATGVLPVAINEGVKLIPFLENGMKMYRARFLLGVTTNTLDIEGEILTQKEVEPLERGLLEGVFHKFVGKISQTVPMYSSKKVNRKPLYKLARKGIAVEPIVKEVEIYAIEILDYSHPHVDVSVACSKGTYIRALANDVGNELGCGATLFTLKRTRHGDFGEDMAVDIESFKSKEDVLTYLIAPEKVVQSFRETIVETALERFLRHGMPVPLQGNPRDWKHGEVTKLMGRGGNLLGIGVVDAPTKTIRIKRLINR